MDATEPSRRDVLTATASGLVLSFLGPLPRAAQAAQAAGAPPLPRPTAFLRIGSDDTVTVVLAHSEMGQGVWTGLAMLLAEELECDWAKVRVEHGVPSADLARLGRGVMATGGSSSTRGEFDRYRTAGATARVLLVAEAARRWKVEPASCRVEAGVVSSGGHRATFGALAEGAMKLPLPASVPLKASASWRLIGTPVKRLDTPEKMTGRARFGLDVQLPGLKTALIARPPAFGATLKSFDAARALEVPGVEKVLAVSSGVAVVGAHFWAARMGRDALQVEWNPPAGGGPDSEKLLAELRALVKRPGLIAKERGDVTAALKASARRTIMEYDVPYLAHAPMEPLNCTAKVDAGGCELWTGSQSQSWDQQAAAKVLGIPKEKVVVHTEFLGGSFGRRANPASDFVVEAVELAKALGVPVKTVWTREDDIRGGYYRPAFVHRLEVGTDAKGKPLAWRHVAAGQSVLEGTPFHRPGVDEAAVEGIDDSPYLDGVGALQVSAHSPKSPITVQWWRSVGNTHTAFALECALDELAHAAKRNPLDFRLELLADKPRYRTLLELAAEKAGWGRPLPKGHGLGLAMHESFGSVVAEVAEVSREKQGVRVHRVVCAVDCGTVVNPLAVEAQVQSSVAYGLSAVLFGTLTVVGGKVKQSNFHDYRPLRMSQMPKVEVHLRPSEAPMGGIGEPATAPVAPAVANALFAATGKRVRSLPL